MFHPTFKIDSNVRQANYSLYNINVIVFNVNIVTYEVTLLMNK